ncbi:MAG: TIGR02391 family protein [Opitutaceae bacterium]
MIDEMAMFPQFNPNHFEQIARALGDVVTGTQLDGLFANCGIPDTSGESTKWRRIHYTLTARQVQDRCGNHVAAFIMAVMTPARFVDRPGVFEETRKICNRVLAFDGFQLGEDGKFRRVAAASTISEARRRADTIASRLQGRDIHPEVLKYCREELMQDNYFHAVFEAAKGVAQRVREMTGLTQDGVALVDMAFAERNPLIWMNPLRTETDRSEHRGFALLIKGAFAAIRNPTAHVPKILWQGEDDAADYFTLLSLLHRKLDKAKVVRPTGGAS